MLRRGRGRARINRDDVVSSDSALGYTSGASSRGGGRGRGALPYMTSVSEVGRNRASEERERHRTQPRSVSDLQPNVQNISHGLANTERIQINQYEDAVAGIRPIEKVEQYHHRQPESGDQGIKPSAEKLWPDMWHGDKENGSDRPILGVSPFSESGRFVVAGKSNINTHKKNKKYEFSGCERVSNVSAQDSHQTIARSLQVQAPPKAIPDYLFHDFVDNSRNTCQLLNEFCQFQRKSLRFEDVAAKESYKNYSILVVVDGFEYAPAEAWKKKLAKEAACRNALKRILIEYYSDMDDFPKVDRLKSMKEGEEKISRDQDHPTRYRPQPRIKLNELSLDLITKIRKEQDDVDGAENARIAEAVWEKMDELNISSYRKQVVAVVINWTGVFHSREPLVVSLATGNQNGEANDFKQECASYTRDNKWGRVLQDTSPWVLARRGLKRYLLNEAKNFYQLQYENRFDEFFSIFEIPANNTSSQVLALKEGIEIVFFASSVPTMRDNATLLNERPNTFFNRGADKLLRSMVLGVQGSLNARLMEPIYASRIIIGGSPGAINDSEVHRFTEYITENLTDEMAMASHELAGVYHVFRPAIQKVSLEGFPVADGRSNAVSWVHLAPLRHSNTKKTAVELIDPASGYRFTYQRGDRSVKKQGVSRLCKFAQWDLYIKSLTTRRMKIQDQDSSYRLSKYHAKDYRLTKEALIDAWIEIGIGEWPCDPAVYELDIDQPRRENDVLLTDVNLSYNKK